MSDESEGKSEDVVPPHRRDLEESLMEAVEEDSRFKSGTASPESDNVLDFIQMSGLVGPANTGAVDTSAPIAQDFEPPPLERVSFFEEGVGDVDSSMDPILPIPPEIDLPGDDYDDQKIETRDSDSVRGLEEIISDLKHNPSEPPSEIYGSESFTELAALETTAEPRSDYRKGHAEAALSTASTSENNTFVATEDEPDQLYLRGITADSVPDTESEEEHADYDGSVAASTVEDLAEARSLLDRLDISGVIEHKQTADGKALGLDAKLNTSIVEDEAEFEVAEEIATPRRRRSRRKRSIRRWLVRAIMFAIIGGAGYAVFQFYLNQTETPEAAYRAAEKMLEEGQYAKASNAFQAFTRRFPMEIRRSDAMFMAGYAMQLVPSVSSANAEAAYVNALALLEGFVVEYPDHLKTARAETLTGMVYFNMGRYLEAIGILGDPERRLRDPGAYMTSLRTLGRAYAATSRIENAHSAFMRAASLEENISPDQDYAELASLHQKFAEHGTVEEDRHHHYERAIEQWNYALRVPGLLKDRKDKIKLLRDVVASRLDGDFAGQDTKAMDASFFATSDTERNMGRDGQHDRPSPSEDQLAESGKELDSRGN